MSVAIPTTTENADAYPLSAGQRLLASGFKIYKVIVSPVLHAFAPSRCLYVPTCSEFAYVAVSRFGVVRGSWMSLRRFARCHPWGKGGLDPVPERCAHGTLSHTCPSSSNSASTPSDHLS